MEMMYLIFGLSYGYGSVVMPEKYPKDQCEKIAKEFEVSSNRAKCVPAPKYNCYRSKSEDGGRTSFAVGDFCNPPVGAIPK